MGLISREISVPTVVVSYLTLLLAYGFLLTAITCSRAPRELSVNQSPPTVISQISNNDSSKLALAHGRSLLSLESEDKLEGMPKVGVEVSISDPVSALDISELDLIALHESLPKLYHSPKVFTLSYEEMREQLQIWVYPTQAGSTKYEHNYDGDEDVTEEISSTADLFFRLLTRSEFVTEKAKRAQLFLLPFSIDVLWVDLGPTQVAEKLRRYLEKVRTNYPYWESSLGADHFYLSCHAFEHNSKHRNILELGKNSIQAACAPLRHNQKFYPHKDVVFPQYKPVGEEDVRLAILGRRNRTSLAYFSGCPDVTTPLLSAFHTWETDPDFIVEANPSPHRLSVHRNLARSRFCVSVLPHDTFSLVDALRFGCVPVLLSKLTFHDLPFQGFLNWGQFAVVLGIEDLPNLKQILANVSSTKHREMQYLGHQAIKHLEWNNPPVAYDAFHMTLLELWVRRHSIKYTRQVEASSFDDS